MPDAAPQLPGASFCGSLPAPKVAFNAITFSADGFVRDLVKWFGVAQRDLPWRREENARDPYRIVVSEFMLQQTTVAAVIPFYHRFLARFPTIESLAAATFEEVLPLWAGLGYYSRARNLHALAGVVMEKHGGVFPRDFSSVLALPGVGRYTAGAVTSIAFDLKTPIVDANVARVFARVFCLQGDLKNKENQAHLWQRATEIVESCDDENPPSQLNPALMELGALVCTPRAPQCQKCPVAEFCVARTQGRQNELPHVAARRETVELRDACVLCKSTPGFGRTFLRRRARDAKIWWRGMWELPRVTARDGESTSEAAARMLREEFGLTSFQIGAKLQTVTHGVTHHRITLDCFLVEADLPAKEDRGWFTFEDIENLALPSTMRALLKKIGAQDESAARETVQPSLWSEE